MRRGSAIARISASWTGWRRGRGEPLGLNQITHGPAPLAPGASACWSPRPAGSAHAGCAALLEALPPPRRSANRPSGRHTPGRLASPYPPIEENHLNHCLSLLEASRSALSTPNSSRRPHDRLALVIFHLRQSGARSAPGSGCRRRQNPARHGLLAR